ncbi:hypothetical protein [Nonlabens arenilitoris]|nr:hypothetical protein [Nonlabens arenilitoris]
MNHTFSPNGYSDYKRKTIDDHEDYEDDVNNTPSSSRFESYL